MYFAFHTYGLHDLYIMNTESFLSIFQQQLSTYVHNMYKKPRLVWNGVWTLGQFVLNYSDIEVAMAQSPKHIRLLADEVGILPDELDLYGNKKAKVSLDVLNRLESNIDGKYIVVTGWVMWNVLGKIEWKFDL